MLTSAKHFLLLQFFIVFHCGHLLGQNVELLQRARLLPMHLDTCELVYTSEVSRLGPRKLAVDRDKFYLNTGKMTKTVAFDGVQHWSKDNDGKGAVISKLKPFSTVQLDLHPLILPYSWFWENIREAKWSDLKSNEMWDAVIKRMAFRESLAIRGHECCVYEIAYSDDNMFLVAIDMDGFPIQVESKRNGEPSKLDVLKVVQHSSGATIGTDFLKTRPDKTQSKVFVDSKSLRINEKVDPALFIFDPSGVVDLINLDGILDGITLAERTKDSFDVAGTPDERFAKAKQLIQSVNQNLLIVFANPSDPRVSTLMQNRMSTVRSCQPTGFETPCRRQACRRERSPGL